MDDVPILIDHNIPVMPVLHLQDIADEGVGGHALDEVSTSLQESQEQDSVPNNYVILVSFGQLVCSSGL